jgi:hypothetical protein
VRSSDKNGLLSIDQFGFDHFDIDGDGFVTKVEFNGNLPTFGIIDADGDGRITREEFNNMRTHI